MSTFKIFIKYMLNFKILKISRHAIARLMAKENNRC